MVYSSGSTAHPLRSSSLKHSTCVGEACQDRNSSNLTHRYLPTDCKAKSLRITSRHQCTPSDILGYRPTPVWAWSYHRYYRLPSWSLSQLTAITYHVSPHGVGTCIVTPGCRRWRKQKQNSAGSDLALASTGSWTLLDNIPPIS